MTNRTIDDLFKFIQSNEIKFVDFRFTDHLGSFHHIARHVTSLNSEVFQNGICFDSSSIKGWKSIEHSDMVILPDLNTAFLDLFTAQPTLVLICDVIDVDTNAPYSRDPRRTAKMASQYMINIGVADKAYFGMELEFFIFDDVRFELMPNSSFYALDSSEGQYNSGRKYDYGNNAYRPKIKGGYMPVQPIDSTNDIRAEILENLISIGLKPILHHHEVAASQCEVGFMHDELLQTSDNLQKSKYVIHNVASSYGKTATFMPKPIKDDNGSGMHCHQSIWENNTNLFTETQKEHTISETALYYIGGILKHAKAINAFTNPTINSYKRLVSGYEAPVKAVYSLYNRSAAIRIPYAGFLNKNSTRIEVRFPDPTANPYYCNAAMLMAGLDGIKNKVHPGKMVSTNLFQENEKHEKLAGSLSEALDELNKDRQFLTKNDVFTDDQIDSYIALKREEIDEYNSIPTPWEFFKYYAF